MSGWRQRRSVGCRQTSPCVTPAASPRPRAEERVSSRVLRRLRGRGRRGRPARLRAPPADSGESAESSWSCSSRTFLAAGSCPCGSPPHASRGQSGIRTGGSGGPELGTNVLGGRRGWTPGRLAAGARGSAPPRGELASFSAPRPPYAKRRRRRSESGARRGSDGRGLRPPVPPGALTARSPPWRKS